MPHFSDKNFKLFAILSLLCLAIVHFFLLNKYEINFPFEDSHGVFLSYLYSYKSEPSLLGKLSILFGSVNESRPVLMRLAQNIQLSVFGQLNLKSILIFCNLYLILIIWVFFKKYFQVQNKTIFIISIFSIFSLCNFELYFRNDVLLYQTATVSLTILIFYLITKQNSNRSRLETIVLLLALIFVPLGTAIGYISLVIAGVYSCFLQKNNLWKSIIAILGLQVFISIYYYSPSQEEGSIVGNIIKYNYELVVAFFMAVGGFVHIISNTTGQVVAVIVGLFITLTPLVFFVKNCKNRKFDFELLVYLFSVICLVAIVLKRYNYWEVGYESVLESRYKIYGILIFIIFCYQLTESFRLKYVSSFLILFSIGLYIIWLLKSVTVLNQKRETQFYDAYNIERGIGNTEKVKYAYVDKIRYDYLVNNKFFDPKEAYRNVAESISKGIRIKPSKVSNNKVSFDTNMEGDWAGRTYKYNKITIEAKLPIATNYFLEITDKNNKKILLNGLPEPKSLTKRLFEKQSAPFKLSREFDNEFFEIEDPISVEVICTDIYH